MNREDMTRAITFIEILAVLTVIVISAYFLSPIFLRIQNTILLHQEIEHIRSFIYYIQTKAKYRKQSYSITIAQNKQNHQYCIIAVAKKSDKQTACDCLFLPSCRIQSDYHLYQSQNSAIVLKSQSLYPEIFFNIDGNAARLGEKCLGLSLNETQEVIQFDEAGGINVVQKNKRTKCR